MSKTFAIADLHGRLDLLLVAIERIELGSPSGGKIVFLGDYVDRGPESAGIIRRLMQGPSDPTRWVWVCLQGNHEAMMLHCLANLPQIRWWIGNGGGATLISYGHPPTGTVDPNVVPEDHLKWLSELPTFYEDDNRIFVHAGTDPSKPMAIQEDEVLQWKLYGESDPGGHDGKHVVHGHEQFADGPKLHLGRTDLDTFAWATGRIVVGVFEDGKDGGPTSFIEVKGAPHPQYGTP